MGAFKSDVRYALRSLARAPAFVLVAVLTLGAGTGGVTAMYSILYGSLLRPLAYAEADRLVVLQTSRRDEVFPATSKPDLDDVRAASRELVDVGTWRPWPVTLTPLDGPPTRALAASVDSRYFSLLGMAPALGRAFAAEDDLPGHEPVVVLSHAFWRSAHGGDPELIGRQIDLDGGRYTVVGVAPRGFIDPLAARHAFASPPLWRASPEEFQTTNRTWRSFRGLGRLAPGSSIERVRAELTALGSGLEEAWPNTNADVRLGAVPLREHLVGSDRLTIVVLSVAVLLVLVIACANVASLLLTRAATRSGESAVRRALGADRLRVSRPLVVEHALIGVLGFLFGLGMAWGLTRAFEPWTRGLATLVDIRIDWPVLLGSAALCALTIMGFGVAAVLRAVEPEGLVGASRGAIGGPGTSLRKGFVIAEIALAVTLLISAGLLLRSLENLKAVDVGVRVDGAVVATLTPSVTRHGEAAALHRVVHEIIDAVGGVPGVQAVGVVSDLPLTGAVNSGWITRPDRPLPAGQGPPSALYRTVAGAYFPAAGIRLLTGRTFQTRDDLDAPPVIVLNETAARDLFPEGGLLGKKVQIMGREREIVGVVSDVREEGPHAASPMAAYVPFNQETQEWAIRSPSLFVHTTVDDPWDVAPLVREAILKVDPTTAINDLRTMGDVEALATGAARFRTALLSAFAAVAFSLAVFGLASVVAYQASQRRRELGLRMALGATRGQVVALLVAGGVRLTLVGTTIGVALAMPLGRSLEHLLFGVRPVDPLVLVVVPSALVATSVVAALLPAASMTRFEPAVTLRDD